MLLVYLHNTSEQIIMRGMGKGQRSVQPMMVYDTSILYSDN